MPVTAHALLTLPWCFGAPRCVRLTLTLVALCAMSGCGEAGMVDACRYRTIQQAIDRAPSGSSVWICEGLHDQSIVLRKPLTIVGAGPGRTILTGGGAAAVISVQNVTGEVRVENMTLRPRVKTRTGVGAVQSDWVSLAELNVDLGDLDLDIALDTEPDQAVSPSGERTRTEIAGIEVQSSSLRARAIRIQNVRSGAFDGVGVHVRALSHAMLDHLLISGSDGPAILVSDSVVSLTESLIRDANRGVEVLSGRIALSDSTIANARNDAISLFGGELHANDVELFAPQRYGVLAAGGIASLHGVHIIEPTDGIHVLLGTVLAMSSSIDAARESGVFMGDAGFVDFVASSIVGCRRGALLNFPSGEVGFLDATIEASTERGIELLAGVVQMQGGAVQNSGKEGLFAGGGSLLADRVLLANSGSDGIVLRGATTAVLSNITSRANAGLGLLCDGGAIDGGMSSVELASCTGDFSDNANGRAALINGCEVLYSCSDMPL
jgi:hypothetical protein